MQVLQASIREALLNKTTPNEQTGMLRPDDAGGFDSQIGGLIGFVRLSFRSSR